MTDIAIMAEYLGLPFEHGYYVNSYELMGWFPQLDYNRTEGELQFDTSWDWLMPVLEKLSEAEMSCADQRYLYRLIQASMLAFNFDAAYHYTIQLIKLLQ